MRQVTGHDIVLRGICLSHTLSLSSIEVQELEKVVEISHTERLDA